MKRKITRVLIDNRQSKKRLNLTKLSGITSRALALLGKKNVELSLSFVTNSAIKLLNRKYRSSFQATDVLAFSMGPVRGGMNLLGDVVISVEKASSQARRLGEPFEKELVRLIIHGILHLIGYRDKRKSDRIRMFNRQEGILSVIYETP